MHLSFEIKDFLGLTINLVCSVCVDNNLSAYRVLDKCYIKRNEDHLGKFDSSNDEGIFLGYSSTKKAYRCFNKRLHKIVESVDVRIDDIKPRIHDSVQNKNNEDLQEEKITHDEEEGMEKEYAKESE